MATFGGGGNGAGPGPIANFGGGGNGAGPGPIARNEAVLFKDGALPAIALRTEMLATTTSTANRKVRM